MTSRDTPAPKNIELVVLDIAGTTIDEGGAVYRALAQAVEQAGGSPTASDIETWMGAGKREAIGALLQTTRPGTPPTRAEIGDAYIAFSRSLQEMYQRHPPTPLPGVESAIDQLRSNGTKVALTTGFDRDTTDAILAAVGWTDQRLDAVICVDDVRRGRPAPYMVFRAMEETDTADVTRVLVAGDTPRDIAAGICAGASTVVGVLSGSGRQADLEDAGADHVLPGVRDLPPLLGVTQSDTERVKI